MTIDERIAQYEKQGITVKYNKAVSANDPLKLMYGAVYYKGKAVKKIVDGEDFMVTLLNAPKDGLSIEATYNSDGKITGFKEITN